MLSVHCPNCGGTNIFDETKKIPTFCGFCGSHLPDMTEFVKGSLQVEVDKKQLQNDEKRNEMYMERQKRASKSNNTFLILIIIFVLVCISPFAILFSKIR